MEQIFLNLSNNFPFFDNSRKPIIISGPCSAESEEQVMETCLELSKYKIDALRAGIWKPRTRANSFQGHGEIALKWFKNAGEKTGLPLAVEVANPKHVEACLNAGINILWIGARTTVNPFLVQEIADSLKGSDVTVLVKNPINPDIEMWIGAFERLNKAGITKLIGLHRGFSTYEHTKYRNKPYWKIPIELKRRIPNIKVFCDPSHISGNRDLIFSISQKAIDLDFDGLMIESHQNPTQALSDSSQQVTPKELGEILDKLILKKNKIENQDFNVQLEYLREKIDKIDYEILELLSERMKIVQEIGKYKKENNVTIFQNRRWEEVITNRLKIASQKDLSEEFILEIFESIHQESIKKQDSIINIDIDKKE